MILKGLLPDTETGENIAKDLVGGNLASDLAEIKHAFTDVLCKKIVGDANIYPLLHAADGTKGFL